MNCMDFAKLSKETRDEIVAFSRKSECSGLVAYTVLLNPMIYESSYQTVSIHRTKAGAVRAMQKLKTEMWASYEWEWNEEFTDFKYGKIEIKE